MTDVHQRKIKFIQFSIGGESFECQVKNWKMVNNTEYGEKLYFQCPGDNGTGETREQAEPDWQLEMEFYADWRSDGISDWLQQHDQEDAAFQLDHHYDVVGEHVRWAGDLRIKAPGADGTVRTTEMTSITLPCIGKPAYSRL